MTTEAAIIMLDPMTESLADVLPGGEVIRLDALAPDTVFDPLKMAVDDPTCDRVRDLMPDDPEFAGKVILSCDKPLGHDRRGPHRMRNEHGKTTCTWWGAADND